jgi:FMN phosphatase YigB (HAD superfamily)
MTGLKAIGFDLDNTLYLPIDELNGMIRRDIAKEVVKRKPGLGDVNEVFELCCEQYDILQSWSAVLAALEIKDTSFIEACTSNENILEFLSPDDDVCRLLDELTIHFTMFLVTNSPREFALEKLEKLAITTEYFSEMRFGDDSNATPKSDGAVFARLIEETDMVPSRTIFVGDSLRSDILPAKAASMITAMISDTRVEGPDYIISRLAELRGICSLV